MRYSKYFLFTLKEDPSDAEVISHKLMLRAGMIKKLAAGIYTYLPLGLRVIRKVEQIIRQELNQQGCLELLMPSIQPADLWQESGRWQHYGPELLRIKDRKESDFCYGPTHEEVITDIVRREVKSYRHLPLTLYQIQTKFRDEIRPRFGLMRCREFIMKDAYSFDADEAACDLTYWKMFEAYKRIFSRCGLDFRAVEADSGAIGGSFTHEFHVLAQSGEDTILSCSNCDYTANIEQAECAVMSPSAKEETIPEMREIATPDQKTIEEVSCFLKIPKDKIVKSLIYRAGEKFVMICVPGNREANEVKIRKATGAERVELASEEEIQRFTGGPPGFSGPHGICNMEIFADQGLQGLRNFTAGANKKDTHVVQADWDGVSVLAWTDLCKAAAGEICPRCGKGRYRQFQGIEVGQTFKLGRKYSHKMRCVFLDAAGREQEMVMGCYGIGVGRTMAAAIEQNHDESGIIWPWAVAPFHIALLLLDTDKPETRERAEIIYNQLSAADYEVLLDDREERPGCKFADADLLGIPIRITVGVRALKQGGVEITNRKLGRKGSEVVPVEMILEGVEKFRKLYVG